MNWYELNKTTSHSFTNLLFSVQENSTSFHILSQSTSTSWSPSLECVRGKLSWSIHEFFPHDYLYIHDVPKVQEMNLGNYNLTRKVDRPWTPGSFYPQSSSLHNFSINRGHRNLRRFMIHLVYLCHIIFTRHSFYLYVLILSSIIFLIQSLFHVKISPGAGKFPNPIDLHKISNIHLSFNFLPDKKTYLLKL